MFAQFPFYQPANPLLWQGRDDTPNGRFFQQIEFIAEANDLITPEKKIILLGFASEEGVVRNLGRPGAALGPDALKTQLAKLPCKLNHPVIDLGNILCEHGDLESAQEQFGALISLCQQQGHTTIGFGGGHEIAWAHYQGLASHHNNIGIINFDAHFDIRPHQPGEPGTSGTPFSQIADLCKQQQQPFNYCCIGIQQFGNTPSLFQRADALHVDFLSAEDINRLDLARQIAFLDEFINRVDKVYLSVCLDVLAEAYAPGVSAPQTIGLTPWQIIPLLKHIMRSGKLMSIDIAELSPPLDQDKKTARLAALIVAELLHTN